MTRRKFPAVFMRGGTSKAIEGSIVWKASRRDTGGMLRLAMPSGVLTVGAEASRESGSWQVARGSFYLYRTARRLFEGYVYA